MICRPNPSLLAPCSARQGEHNRRYAPALTVPVRVAVDNGQAREWPGVRLARAEKHLHRYLAEFDFRYNNRKGLGVEDAERAAKMVRAQSGKRLTYQTTRGGRPEA